MLRFALLIPLVLSLSAAEPFPHEVSDLPVDPGVTWGRLDNGLRYAVMPNAQPPGQVSLRLHVEVGSLAETQEERGLAHLLEHLAFNGTTNFPPGELNKRLQPLGIGFGSHSNAHTSFDETVYKLDLPKPDADLLGLGLQVIADYAGGMLILPEEVDRERGVVLAEMRDRDTPNLRIWRALYACLYQGTQVADRFPIGVPEVIQSVTAEEVRAFYEAGYRPEAMVLTVVGEVDPAVVVPLIEAHFAGLVAKGEARPAPDITGVAADPAAVVVHKEADSDATRLSFTALGPETRGVVQSADIRADLVRGLAYDCLNLRLEALAAKDRSGPVITYEVGTWRWLDLRHATVQATLRDRHDEAVALLAREWRRFLDHGPTESEFALSKKNIEGRLRVEVERAARRTNPNLAGQLYNAVVEGSVFMTPADGARIAQGFLEGITRAEVTAAFAATWDQPRRVLSLSGAQADLAAARLAEIWQAAASEPQAAPAEEATAAFAYAERPEAGDAQISTLAAHGITRVACANGVEVAIQPSTRKPGEVRLRCRLAVAPGPRHGAVAGFAARGFIAAGTKAHSAEELGRILAGNSAGVSLRVAEDAVILDATCTPTDLETVFQLLRAYLTEPGWRADDLLPVRERWLQGHDALVGNLDQQVGRTFAERMTGGEPGRRPETRDEVAACDADLLRGWLAPILAEAPMSVAIVGDVDLGSCAHLAMAYLGSLPSRPPMPVLTSPDDLAQVPCAAIPRTRETIQVPGPVARAVIQAAWPTEGFRSVARMRRFNLLADAFQERVQDRLREDLGQAYSPHAWHQASEVYEGFGALCLNAAVDPASVDLALKVIAEEAARLVADGVDADLMAQIQPPFLARLDTLVADNGYWLSSVVDRVIAQPFRLEWATTMRDDVAAITAEEVSDLAKAFLAGEPLIVVGVCPGQGAQGQSEAPR